MNTKSQKSNILVVDDELSIRESFSLILEDEYNVNVAASGEASLKKLVDEKVDLIYLDIRMPGMDGIETLKRLKEIDNDVMVIMVTAVNDVQKASEAIKLGAEDYVVKPFDVKEILGVTKKSLQKKIISSETKSIQGDLSKLDVVELIGANKRIEYIKDIIYSSSDKNQNVILFGEAGVEKELIAKLFHKESKRAGNPFIRFSIKDENDLILQSKFFGSGKGNFASTLEKEKGLFEKASGGTLFIENCEKIPPNLQKDIARALIKKEFMRQGGSANIASDIRVICSFSDSPKEIISKRLIEKELYEIISEISVEVPPLRERASDIPILAEHFIEKFNKKYGKKFQKLSGEVIDVLSGYSFPGNVDELKYLIEKIILTASEDKITIDQLPLFLLSNSGNFKGFGKHEALSFDNAGDILEKNHIENILRRNSGDIASAAQALYISQRALQAKIESLKIEV